MDIVELTLDQLRHIFLVGTHLHTFQGTSSSTSIHSIIKEQGMIQYDPLNPAGRYHDHFLFSRIKNYKHGDFEKIAYKKKLIFEYYNPNLSAISIEHFPVFWPLTEKRILHPYYQTRIEKLNKIKPNMLDEVYNYVKDNGKTTGKDLSHLGKAHKEFASWKSNQASSSALEYLWIMGKLAVVERTSQFQKVYNTVEKYVPKKALYKEDKTLDELNVDKFLVQFKSYPVVNIKNISSNPIKITFNKKQMIPELFFENDDNFVLAKVKGTENQLLVWKNYQDLLAKDPYDEELRLIGVLDPLIWDRDLLKKLFNFEYTWEVYKKEKDRIWGYYVFPLLFKGKFVGRIELKQEKKENEKILKIFNLKLESTNKAKTELQEAFQQLFERLKLFLSVEKIITDKTIKI